MQIDFNKIQKIYGDTILKEIKENFEIVEGNIKYLLYLNFNDVEDIFERYILIFLQDNKEFKENIDKLIISLGEDYVNILENNMELWDDIV